MFLKVAGKKWYGAAMLALALPTGWGFYRFVSSLVSRQSDEPASAFHGVRLGMSAADVRSRFDVPGTFTAQPVAATGWSIRFEGAPSATVGSATFEFHEGLLVAVRAASARDRSLESSLGLVTTPSTVRRVNRGDDGTFQVLILSRSCPEHAEEVRRLLAGS